MPNQTMTPAAPDSGDDPPAVAIRGRGWYLQFDAMPRLPRWLVIAVGSVAVSAGGTWVVALLAR